MSNLSFQSKSPTKRTQNCFFSEGYEALLITVLLLTKLAHLKAGREKLSLTHFVEKSLPLFNFVFSLLRNKVEELRTVKDRPRLRKANTEE